MDETGFQVVICMPVHLNFNISNIIKQHRLMSQQTFKSFKKHKFMASMAECLSNFMWLIPDPAGLFGKNLNLKDSEDAEKSQYDKDHLCDFDQNIN